MPNLDNKNIERKTIDEMLESIIKGSLEFHKYLTVLLIKIIQINFNFQSL